MRLIGTWPLTADDLAGYMVYLEMHGVEEAERNELTDRLIAFSHERPSPSGWEIVGEELVITEREGRSARSMTDLLGLNMLLRDDVL